MSRAYRPAAAAALVVLGIASAAIAQQAGVSGSWNVSGEAAEGASPDGGTWSRSEIRGRLEIAARGDSITGSWTGPRGTVWTLTGKRDGPTFELLTAVQDVPATVDGEQTKVPMRWIFRGTVSSDRLSGTMTMRPEKTGREIAQRFTAERVTPR